MSHKSAGSVALPGYGGEGEGVCGAGTTRDAVVAEHVSKRYGDFVALDDLCLRLRRGSLLGLIGPNGAGKSTTIGCLSGLIDPSAGALRIFGEPFSGDSESARGKIGVMPESLALFDQLQALEFLEFCARMFGVARETARRRAGDLAGFLDLLPAAHRPIAEFSAGMRRKVAFAAAVIHRPDLLLLDEPFAGMDARTVSMLKGWLIRFTARGGTVLVTSHALDTIERLCDEAALMAGGKLLWRGDLSRLACGGELEAGGRRFHTLESLFLHLAGCPNQEPSWL